MRTVRLSVPLEEITRRLAPDPTSGRDDLEEAGRQIAGGEGIGLEDNTVPNDRPIREVAGEIVDWLGWLSGEAPTTAR